MKGKNISNLIKEVRKVLISEDKVENIIVNKIGLPSDISNWITSNYNDKFQLWIANNFKKEAIKRIAGGQETIASYMEKALKGDKTQPSLRNQLNRQKGYFDGAFRHIVQWLQGRREIAPETDDLNLKTLSFEDASRRADRWHEEVQRLKAGAIVDETGNIIKTYINGFYWIDLQKRSCDKEARSMGHCGSGTGNLYSFRKSKNPYLTADVHRNNLVQLRGRANTKPKAEYHPYIIDFLLNKDVGIISMSPSNYRPQNNFELKDLKLEDLVRLYETKPTLFVPDELYKCLLSYPEFAHTVNFKVNPVHEEQKENLMKLHPGMAELFARR